MQDWARAGRSTEPPGPSHRAGVAGRHPHDVVRVPLERRHRLEAERLRGLLDLVRAELLHAEPGERRVAGDPQRVSQGDLFGAVHAGRVVDRRRRVRRGVAGRRR